MIIFMTDHRQKIKFSDAATIDSYILHLMSITFSGLSMCKLGALFTEVYYTRGTIIVIMAMK
jgi:hypothetical protein